MGGGQTFPWQDPRDTAEGRVQPVKERLRAQQSISGSHLHNKWSSHGLSSSHTRMHTHTPLTSVSTLCSSAHANTGSVRWGGRRRKSEEEASYLLEWHSTNTNSLAVSETQAQVANTQSHKIYTAEHRHGDGLMSSGPQQSRWGGGQILY